MISLQEVEYECVYNIKLYPWRRRIRSNMIIDFWIIFTFLGGNLPQASLFILIKAKFLTLAIA